MEYDILFLGSSRMNVMMDLIQIEKDCKCKTINIGIDGAGTYEIDLILKKFLANNNDVGKIYFQIDNTTFSQTYYSYPFHDYQLLPYLNSDKMIRQALKSYSSKIKYYMWRYLPISKHIEFKNSYMGFLKNKNEAQDLNSLKGTELIKRTDYIHKEVIEQLKVFSVDSISIKGLRGIIKSAKENNIEIVLFTSPFHDDYLETYQLPVEFIKQFAEEFDMDYHDFSKEKSLRDSMYYADNAHLNIFGIEKFTSIFIEWANFERIDNNN